MKKFLLQSRSLLIPEDQVGISGFLKIFCSTLVFVLFPLGQLTRFSLFGSGTVYLHELLMFPVILACLPAVTQRYILPLFTKQYYLVLALIGWVLSGLLFSFLHSFEVTPLLYLGRLFGYFLFILSAREVYKTNLLILQFLLLFAGLWYWWLAILQYMYLPDTRFLWLMGWDDHYYRMIGTLFDPGLTGILLLLTALVSYSLRHTIRRWWLLVFLIILLSSVTTFSRATYLSLVVSLLLLFSSNFSGKNALKDVIIFGFLGLCMIIGIYTLIPKPGGEGVNLWRTSTITARLKTATQALNTLQGSDWIIGKGLFSASANTTQSSQNNPQLDLPNKAIIPDNIFITLLTQTGIIGLGLSLLLLSKVIKFLWKENRVLASAVVAVIIQSQFNNTLLHPYIILYLGVFIVSYLRRTIRSSST